MAIDINSLIKKYANPWDTSFSYLDSVGANLGTGYDSYEDAIRKLAFNAGKSYFGGAAEVAPTLVYDGSGESGMGMTAGSPAMPAGWMYSISPQGSPMVYDGSGESGMSGGYTTAGVGSPAFATEQALYDYMLKVPTGPISYESREKYGRPLTEGQRQNMFALLSDPTRAKQVLEAYSGVPDWEYHREAYNAAYNPVTGMKVTGANALVGSTPVFGDDGKITGYKINMNPAHINGADTSGRVQSSSNGATKWDQSMSQYITPIDANTGFVKIGDVPKLSYTSMGGSSYDKAPTMAEQIGKAGTLAFLGSAAGGALGFGPLAGGQAAAGTVAGTGGSMFEGLGDWFSNLVNSGTSTPSGWDFGPLSDSFLGGGIDPVSGLGLSGSVGGIPSGWDFGPLSDSLMRGGVDPVSGMTLNQMQPGLLDMVKNFITQNPGTTAKTALQALTSSGAVSPNILSGLLSGVGGYLSGNAAQDAAKTQAQAQIEAARIAADAAKFRPVGVTTRFGESNFTKDASGNVIGAGYALTPDVKAQQDRLMGMSNDMLTQYQNAPAAFAPMGVAGQRAMNLGNQYLATDPQAQAKKYMDEQIALLATGRERDTNQMLTGEFNRGTYGLSTGGTSTGMMGANPRLEALYNAQRQQDLGLAAQATQGGMDYAKFGAGMVGTGGDLTNAMYQGQVNAFNPYKTALGGAQTLEGLGQNALDLGVNMGKVTNNAQSGMLLANGMNAAANTMAPSNAYSPWGALLSGAGNQVQNYQNTQQQNQQQQQYMQMIMALGGKGL